MTDLNQAVETDSAVYKTLLESTKAIPWKIDWKTMTFAYIGPQIESLLGWTQQSWISANDWAERIHEDERETVVNFCISQSQNGVDHEADYRALTKSGDYVWIRDVVHVVRNAAGEVEALVGFMFDISERKKTEEQVLRLQKELEEFSYKDGLTGINNRRMFDSTLQIEWANAQRTRKPLSLILLDIDYFKQYNDHYGHIKGDDCLKRVGQALQDLAVRPRDCIARYGGEEFVLVLPETDGQAARQVAERCRKLIHKQQIPHEHSNVAPLLTISLGVGTIIPAVDDTPLSFIEAVDKLLYRAKQQGRDRHEQATFLGEPQVGRSDQG
ncbi:sensor domain-containing diguanylate cyclase [Aquipseudomonas ullengensis]|uniref:diguanylate cyclase n=1 Tax=Aquipseudomonas ullengensis TaxID=2759166 RepID=A0A7W4LNR3_9GAMM|nr:sensor domain-containing diguanylate cyclase [Pseudomonas ullengensis]MBB2496513.1 sensor domain-containing diguanylate cyclase [Pseudomonas ullengensis]